MAAEPIRGKRVSAPGNNTDIQVLDAKEHEVIVDFVNGVIQATSLKYPERVKNGPWTVSLNHTNGQWI